MRSNLGQNRVQLGFQMLVEFRGALYFISKGAELWTTDGTSAGTVLVKDLAMTGASNLTVFDGVLYFGACVSAGCVSGESTAMSPMCPEPHWR